MDNETPKTLPTTAELVVRLKTAYQQQITEVVNEFDPEAMKEEIVAELAKNKRQVILKVLGMDNRYGRWEVDHCNGRESPMTAYITEQVQEHIRAWINEVIPPILDAEKEKIKKNLRQAFVDEVYNSTTDWKLRELMKPEVRDLVGAAKKEFMAELRDNTGAPTK